MTAGKILVVDDDKNLLELIKMRLESANYEVTAASDEEEAIEAVKNQSFDLAIIDLQLVNMDGISLMVELRSINPHMPALILTAYGTIESAVEAMRRGAYSYLTKPFDPLELLLQIERALEKQRITSEIKELEVLWKENHDFANIVARSEKMLKVLGTVSQIAATESTVYIYGESGTGKELIARAIHLASGRKDKPFVAINCAALPENLLENELFGHEKGSFTGAIQSTRGLFTQANEGTIFLDEIGDMSLTLQAKLLRVLQERQFYPIGSKKPVEVDVRVVVATNKNLKDEVKRGTFREDLFYRIHVIPVLLPPLRERKEDIPLLIEHFLKKFSKQMRKEVNGITPLALQKLILHTWPGNIRELENTIEYAFAMTKQNTISHNNLPSVFEEHMKANPPLPEDKSEDEPQAILQALKKATYNKSRAARLLGISRRTIYGKIKKYKIIDTET